MSVSPEPSLSEPPGDSGQSGNTEAAIEMAKVLSTPKAPVEEAPAEEAAKTETASDPLSKQYAQLAKREQALRAKIATQELALKAKEEAVAAREAELETKARQYDSGYISKEKLQNQTLQALIEAGLDPQDAIQRIYEQNQNPIDPRMQAKMDALDAKIKALDDANENSKKAQETQQGEDYKRAVAKATSDVKKLVFTSDEFEAVKTTNSIKDVVELMEATFKDGGEITVEEATRQVEEYLIEEAMKFTQLEKIKKRLNPPVAPKADALEQPPKTSQQPQPSMKTLTNTNSSTRKLNARERALAAFKGEKF
jgi:hypothetical protein